MKITTKPQNERRNIEVIGKKLNKSSAQLLSEAFKILESKNSKNA